MQLTRLRRILQQIVLAGLAVSLASCAEGAGDRCTDPAEQTFKLETPADPPLQFRIDGCRVDVDACGVLCALAFDRAGLNDGDTAGITSCEVEFRADAVSVKVGYNVIRNRQLCPLDGGPRPPFVAPP
jgi:hypothetical protein